MTGEEEVRHEEGHAEKEEDDNRGNPNEVMEEDNDSKEHKNGSDVDGDGNRNAEETETKDKRGRQGGKKGVDHEKGVVGVCVHCKKATGPSGRPLKLYRCKCGNEFHHLCAANVGHEEMATCFECA